MDYDPDALAAEGARREKDRQWWLTVGATQQEAALLAVRDDRTVERLADLRDKRSRKEEAQ